MRVVNPVGVNARKLAIERIRSYLQSTSVDDFADADDFAAQLVDQVSSAYRATFESPRAVAVVKRATKSIYEFYRLRDATPFGGDSPIKLKFGGPDTRSVNFINKVDTWYFSKFGDNKNTGLKEFFRDEYLAKGAALFGRQSAESIDDFRQAAGTKLKNLTDRSVTAIVQTSVQRARNWAHIGSLSQARIKLATIVAILDNRTTELCRSLNGKQIRVGVAQKAIERLSKLEPGDFAFEMYENALGKAISKDPAGVVGGFIEDDGVTISDKLVATGRGFPPYHTNCRTRVEGVV